MNVPRAVLEQAERAEALHLQILGKTAPTAPEATEVTPPVEAPSAATPPAEPATPPSTPVVAEAPPAPTPPVAADPDSWETKYRVLEGKYRSEVPRMAAEIRTLKDQLEAAQNAAPAQPAAAVHADALPTEVVERYGSDFAEAVAAVASAQAGKIRDELSSSVQRIEASAAEQARDRFLSELSRFVPTWEQIDRDPGFTAYLDEFDALTGRTRREFFNEADKQNNAARIAAFFQAYAKGKQPVPTPPPAAPQVPAEQVPSVDALIVPDSSRHSEAPEGKKLWTRAEIAKFYADARSQGGKPFGIFTAAQYAAIDADISAAPSEGRVIG